MVMGMGRRCWSGIGRGVGDVIEFLQGLTWKVLLVQGRGLLWMKLQGARGFLWR